jgi:hypothetical protein
MANVANRSVESTRALRDALVTCTVSAVVSLVQWPFLGAVQRADSDILALLFGSLLLYGAGLLFALQLALAGWVVGLPRPFHRAPWVAMALGQPMVLVAAVLAAAWLPRARDSADPAFGAAATGFSALGALILIATVARRRAQAWSRPAVAWLVLISAAWAVAFGTPLLGRWWPRGDLGYLLAVAAWQMVVGPAYACWVWPREKLSGAAR